VRSFLNHNHLNLHKISIEALYFVGFSLDALINILFGTKIKSALLSPASGVKFFFLSQNLVMYQPLPLLLLFTFVASCVFATSSQVDGVSDNPHLQHLRLTSRFLDEHQSEAVLKSKIITKKIKMAHSYVELGHNTGFHVESYHSHASFDNETSIAPRRHPKFIDIDADLFGLLPTASEARCFVDANPQLKVSLFKLSLAFSTTKEARAALNMFDGADFKFLHPENARDSASSRVPFSVKGCGDSTKVFQLVALSASLIGSTLQLVGRGALPHELYVPGTEGGFIMTPVVYPSVTSSNASSRSAQTLADSASIIFPYASSLRFASNTNLDILFSVTCTPTSIQLWQYNTWPLSDTQLSYLTSTTSRSYPYTTGSGNGNQKVYVYITCSNGNKVQSPTIDINWVDPSNPNELTISKPLPFALNKRSQTLTVSMYSKAGQGKPASAGKTIMLYRAGWLYSSTEVGGWSIDELDPATCRR
jgi:hypothetical protein